MYNEGKFDTHSCGVNAIVAVVAYTGYDMEDAMIINKMSYDRGFMAGNVYKQKIVKAFPESAMRNQHQNWRFSNKKQFLEKGMSIGGKVTPDMKKIDAADHMEEDGLPKVGEFIRLMFSLAVFFCGTVCLV